MFIDCKHICWIMLIYMDWHLFIFLLWIHMSPYGFHQPHAPGPMRPGVGQAGGWPVVGCQSLIQILLSDFLWKPWSSFWFCLFVDLLTFTPFPNQLGMEFGTDVFGTDLVRYWFGFGSVFVQWWYQTCTKWARVHRRAQVQYILVVSDGIIRMF